MVSEQEAGRMSYAGDGETSGVQVIGRLVIPDGVLFEGEVDAVTVRTIDGDATFLSGHIPLVAALVPGGAVGFAAATTAGAAAAAASGDPVGAGGGASGGRSAVLEQGGFVEVDGEVVTVSAPVAV